MRKNNTKQLIKTLSLATAFILLLGSNELTADMDLDQLRDRIVNLESRLAFIDDLASFSEEERLCKNAQFQVKKYRTLAKSSKDPIEIKMYSSYANILQELIDRAYRHDTITYKQLMHLKSQYLNELEKIENE